MFKTLAAGLTALSLALAPVPAVANTSQSEDFAKLIFGLITLGAVASAIDDRRDDRREARQPEVAQAAPQDRQQPFIRYHGDGYGRQEARNQGGFVPPRSPNAQGRFGTAPNMTLPRACYKREETRLGQQRYVERRCLERRFSGYHQLPRGCAIRFMNVDGFARAGFDPSCLRESGYRRQPD